MKRASTGWPVKGLSTRLRPARGFVRYHDSKGQPRYKIAPAADWRDRIFKSNAEACVTGYVVKARRIRQGKGNHRAVCFSLFGDA